MKKLLFLFLAFMLSATLYAGDKDSLRQAAEKLRYFIDSVNKTFKYETGTISLPNGIAKLNIPAGFKFLDAKQSKYVISDLWGNPPSEDILGMIFPGKGGAIGDSSYAFVITYNEMGYVKDEDADEIDYDEMMKTFHKEEPEENKEREKQGYPPIHTVGWAAKPFYDKQNKVLHWAKELKFGTEEGVHTLNYDIRILGRKGILSLNAVSTMNELPLVKQDIDEVVHMAAFTEGNTYKDFNPDVDEVAAWTIGGLVAGKVLAKAGALVFLAKFWKLIVLGFVALGGFLMKFFKRRKAQEAALQPEQETAGEETPVGEPPVEETPKTAEEKP